MKACSLHLKPTAMGSAAVLASSLSTASTPSATVTDSSNLTGSAEIILEVNAPPTAPTVTLAPNPATTLDDLTATSGSVDYDNDSITYSYSWSLDGIVSNASSSDTLPNTATSKGDIWTLTVTPQDPYSEGPSSSQNIEIDNQPQHRDRQHHPWCPQQQRHTSMYRHRYGSGPIRPKQPCHHHHWEKCDHKHNARHIQCLNLKPLKCSGG